MPVSLERFTRIPYRFFSSGMAAEVGESAALIYLALWDHANRERDNTFSVSDRALAADTGIAPRTISDARKALIERALIACTRESGRSYQYTLTEPTTLKWKAQKERPRAKDRPRGNQRTPGVNRAELLLERAAIIEYCCNVPRGEAERLASEQMRAGGRKRKWNAPQWVRQHIQQGTGQPEFNIAIFAVEESQNLLNR